LAQDKSTSLGDPTPLSDAVKKLPGLAHIRANRSAEQTVEESKLAERTRRFAEWRKLAERIGERYANSDIRKWKCYGADADRSKQKAVVKQVTDYIHQLPERVNAGSGLVLFGPPGTGKDLLASVAMREAILTHGLSVDWVNGSDLFGKLRDAITDETPERTILSRWIKPKILVLSDPLPPWGDLTEYQAVSLFRIIDARYRCNCPTWVTLNVADGKEAAKRMGPQVVSRLRHGAVVCVCDWPDFRSVVHGKSSEPAA
jgi:DNA replication protein DnaC